jgi:site-specific DNA-methyltransferase (adenine-specific)
MIRGTTTIHAGSTLASITYDDSLPMLHRLAVDSVDVVFADPPYFLSGGGSTCKAGKRVSVDKGAWDVPIGPEAEHAFACRWISALTHAMKSSASLFISGTHHSIRHVHRAAVDTLGWSLINSIAWIKPNPPPNLACKSLQHATETILWLRPPGRRPGDTHFNYKAARAIRGVQMRDDWRDIPAPTTAEKVRGGKHPTQKPLALLERIMLIALPRGGVVVDPFLGSGTTLEAAALAGAARFYGADKAQKWFQVSLRRGENVERLIAERAAAAAPPPRRRRAA